MRTVLTIGIWATSLIIVALAALIAAEFVLMASSIDPSDLIATDAGALTDTWINAGISVSAFVGLVAISACSLRMWHSRRFKVAGLILTVVEAGCVALACTKVYNDYL